jgi:RNA-directed DNA polymerase
MKFMSVNRQQVSAGQIEQLDLFAEHLPALDRGSSPRSGVAEAFEPLKAHHEDRAATEDLMERVAARANLFCACRKVKANKGSAGVDRQTVHELAQWLETGWHELREELLGGKYEPEPVRGVQIPKPAGGVRQLGIPTVKDRLVQQAVVQVLEPLLDPGFSESSFGFRPGRNAHDALRAGSAYVEEGRETVVDLDLEKFFDRVNHDILMSRLARHVKDKRLLKLVRRFLQAGMMQEGVCVRREEGTPQGGPLSPLLANLLLDDLDKELERRGHRFCRYADDCNIYVYSQKAGERVLVSVTRFLERKLKLKVNRTKSAVAPVWERKFLGYRLLCGGRLGIAPQSVARLKEKVRHLTKRNRGCSLERVVSELNSLIRGWVAYFRLAEAKGTMRNLDAWMRRKIRCLKLKQCKRAVGIARFLMSRGVERDKAWMLGGSGKGWWRMALSQQAHRAMGKKWFKEIGLTEFEDRYIRLELFT